MSNFIKIFSILFEQLKIFQKNKEANIDKLFKEINNEHINNAKIEYLFKKIYQINLGVSEIELLLKNEFIEDKAYLIKTYPKIYTIKSGKLIYTIVGEKSNNTYMKIILKSLGIVGIALSLITLMLLIYQAFNFNFMYAISLFILLLFFALFMVYPVEKVLDRIERAEAFMSKANPKSEISSNE